MRADIESMAVKLLDWIYEQTQSSADAFYDIQPFTDEYLEGDRNAGRTIVEFLESRGLVNPTYTFGCTDAGLTPRGIQQAQRSIAARRDPSQRIPALRTAMLRWLLERESTDNAAMSWHEFKEAPPARFMGDRFKLAETERQAEYLWSNGLIAAISIEEEREGCVRPTLTPEGQDCVIEFGGRVSDYLNRGSRPANVNNIHIADNQGNLSIAGENFTQSITSGVDTSQLLKFAGAVRQLLPTLNLDDEDAEELDRQAEELHAAASDPEPNVGKLRSLWAAVMQGITKAAPTVAGELVTNLGQEAAKAIGAG